MSNLSLHRCTGIRDPDELADCLNKALRSLPPGSLPLRGGCEQGGLVDDSDLSVSVLAVDRTADQTTARVGVFFTEIVGGCSCHDDPVRANAYCMLEVVIRNTDGDTRISPLES